MTRVALVSLEPLDRVWQRHQQLAAELVNHGIIEGLVMVRNDAPKVESQSLLAKRALDRAKEFNVLNVIERYEAPYQEQLVRTETVVR